MNASTALLDDPVARATYTQWTAGEGHAVSRLRVSGLHCAACAGIIENALHEVPGVLDARVHAGTARVKIRWDPARVQLSALARQLEPLGYQLQPDAAASGHDTRVREQRQSIWRVFVAGFCMMQVMMLAVPLYVARPGEMPADQQQLLVWGSWVMTLPVMLFSARPFFAAAASQLRARRIGMDTPVALAIAVCFVASSGAAFDPGGWFGDEVWFDSLTMFVFLLLGARVLEERARHRVAAEIEHALDRLPTSVQRVDEHGVATSVSPAQLRRGDQVRVAVGEAFAADGTLVEGHTRADEALLTGESTPRRKHPGDSVVAGSLNVESPVLMRVERAGADTRYQAIVELMNEALEQRPQMLRSADRIASWVLAGVLVLAAGGAVAWSFIDASRAVWVAVAVLIVTCPCALSLAAPSALLASAGALARRGLLVQRLDALEGLARLQHLFLDKTGTLTEDRLEFLGVFAAGGGELAPEVARAVREHAASLAIWSRHPLSRSLVECVGDVTGELWTDIEEHGGLGLRARSADGHELRLGSAAWLGVPGVAEEPSGSDRTLWFGRQGGAVYALRFRERLRPDAAQALRELRADGVRLTLLSGDEPSRVDELARRLSLDGAFGGMTPQDKLDAVIHAQAGGAVVGMIGDGINDAPVLARADVSIAMGEGALVAKRRADLVVMSMRLTDVAAARRRAQRTMRIIHQNFAGSIVYNLVCIPLALAGVLPPWLAGAGMAASSLAVMLNALRLRSA